MPPRQVYGKKKAHVFNNKVFLETPVKIRSDETIEELTATVSKLQLTAAKPCTHLKQPSPRQALGEICDNRRKSDGPHGYSKSAKASSPPSNAPSPVESLGQERDRETPSSQELEKAKPESTQPSEVDLYASHLDPLLSLGAPKPTPFLDFDSSLGAHFEISKIAEASFSQVFMLSLPDSGHKSPSRSLPRASVLKLIPITPPTSLIPKRPTKKLCDLLNLCSTPINVASEVRLLQHLCSVPGFTNFRALHLLRGRPGPAFCASYKAWDMDQKRNGRERSHFPDPNREASYGEDQLWAVIEMQDAGTDLEHLIDSQVWHDLGIEAVWDVFWQVILACGKAETASRFEHRDMHLGNICVKLAENNAAELSRHHPGRGRKLGMTGLEATVIDYTISRAEIPSTTDEEEIVFIDLDADQALFEGDGEEEYQYEIYRYMRSAVFLDDPVADYNDRYDEVEASERMWRGYHPQSNVVWLHFILYRLLETYEYWQAEEPNETPEEGGHYSVLQELNSMLAVDNWQASTVRSAGDLVAMALERKWLDVEDVVGRVVIPVEKHSRRRKVTTKTNS